MAAESSEQHGSFEERKRLIEWVDKILPIARAADAIASRTVGKVGTFAVLGLASALWIAAACALSFDWGWKATLSVFVPLAIPGLVLSKIYGTLRAAVGLPQRVVATSDRLFGKISEVRQRHAAAQQAVEKAKPKLRDMWGNARFLLELRSLGDEGRELWNTMAGAVVMATPIFAIVMAVSIALCFMLIMIAAAVGLAFVF